MADKKQPLLHEMLAVEQDLKGNSERARNQLVEMFRKTKSLYRDEANLSTFRGR